MTKTAMIIGYVCIVVCSATPVGATTVLEKDFPALVQEAETIAVGTVIGIEVVQEGETPFTLVTFSDLDILKGDSHQEELTVSVMGGPSAGGLRLHIAGVPEFTLGDRMVVFIVGNETQAVPFVGMWQGVYRVVQDPEQGTERMADHAGRPLTVLPQRQSADGLVHDDAPSTVQTLQAPALSLDAFLEAIAEKVQDEQ